MSAPEHAQVVRPARNILERAGPPAPGIPDAAVLQSPRGEPRLGERGGEAPDVTEAVFGEPAPAVEDDRDRVRALAFRQTQLAELQRVAAVGDPAASDGDGQLLNVLKVNSWARPVRAPRTTNMLSVKRKHAFIQTLWLKREQGRPARSKTAIILYGGTPNLRGSQACGFKSSILLSVITRRLCGNATTPMSCRYFCPVSLPATEQFFLFHRVTLATLYRGRPDESQTCARGAGGASPPPSRTNYVAAAPSPTGSSPGANVPCDQDEPWLADRRR